MNATQQAPQAAQAQKLETLSVRVPEELMTELKFFIVPRRLTQTETVRRALQYYIQAVEKAEQAPLKHPHPDHELVAQAYGETDEDNA